MIPHAPLRPDQSARVENDKGPQAWKLTTPWNSMVRVKGLEPSWGCPHTDLNRTRLPIPPHPHCRSSLTKASTDINRLQSPLQGQIGFLSLCTKERCGPHARTTEATRRAKFRPGGAYTSLEASEAERDKMLAYTAPEMLCHTLNTAPGTAASGIVAKWTVAREVARPEFCMPTSMDKVRR